MSRNSVRGRKSVKERKSVERFLELTYENLIRGGEERIKYKELI